MNAGYQPSPQALNRVRARLVQRLTSLDIIVNGRILKVGHFDFRDYNGRGCANRIPRIDQEKAGDHLVPSAPKPGQHPDGISRIERFSQDAAFETDNGIRSKNNSPIDRIRNFDSLGTSQDQGRIRGRLSDETTFVNLTRHDGKPGQKATQ